MQQLPRVSWMALLAGASLAWATAAHSATIEGQHFDDTLRLAQTELQLNGLGVRAVLFIKGYAAGLYLTQKASSFQALREVPGPKRLQLRMLRGAGPEVFVDALRGGMRKNLDAAALQQLAERTAQLQRSIEAYGATAKGDVIDFDYLPGRGTTLAVNGAVNAPPIAGADFFEAVLAIFTGEHPVDAKLKQGLLGH